VNLNVGMRGLMPTGNALRALPSDTLAARALLTGFWFMLVGASGENFFHPVYAAVQTIPFIVAADEYRPAV
jgi:hypothetical protein